MKKYLVIFLFLLSCQQEEKKHQESPSIDTAQELRSLINKFPDSSLLKEQLIQYYREYGKYDKAIAETKKILLYDSLNDRWFDILATLQYENMDTLNAINSFEKAIQLVPSPVYMISLGTLYAQTINPRAIPMAELLFRTDLKAEKEASFIKGLYHSYSGDKKESLKDFDKCISLNFTFMEAYREKAIALYDLNRYEDAIAVLEKAITLQNNFDEGYYYRGRCEEKLGLKSDAIASYKTALAYDPTYIEAKEALSAMGINEK